MLWIGISGRIGSGKTTLAEQLTRQLADRFKVRIIPIADGVREVVALETTLSPGDAAYKLFRDWGYSSSYATIASKMFTDAIKLYPTISGEKNRRLLQMVGTEIGRGILRESIWIDLAHRKAIESGADIVLSPDIRFDNEASAIDVHIHIITHDIIEYQSRIALLRQDQPDYDFSDHSSEQSLSSKPDYYIHTNFTQADIKALGLFIEDYMDHGHAGNNVLMP